MSVLPARVCRHLFFLPSEQGKLYAIYYHPPVPSKSAVLIIPPFAEELNRSRRHFTLLARRLAEHGVNTLIVDLFGTGDSEGEFAEASWSGWSQDLIHSYRWLIQQGVESISMLALRSGALLASSLAQNDSCQIDKMCLWQPQLQGAQLVKQLLRQLASAEMLRAGDGRSMNTRQFEERLQQNCSLDISGYTLTPSLYQSILSQQLNQHSFVPCRALAWFDVVSQPGQKMPRPNQQLLNAWREHDEREVIYQQWEGEPFWSLYECDIHHSLLKSTVDYFLE